mgnify:CR=1 FL=1
MSKNILFFSRYCSHCIGCIEKLGKKSRFMRKVGRDNKTRSMIGISEDGKKMDIISQTGEKTIIDLDVKSSLPLQSKGFAIPVKGATNDDYHSSDATVLSSAPKPILPVSGKIEIANIQYDHFTTSANMLSGELATHKTAQDAFNEFDFVLGGTEEPLSLFKLKSLSFSLKYASIVL